MSPTDALVRGREAFARDAWASAFALLSEAARDLSLDPEDLDRLATAAFLVGDDAASVAARSEAHAGYLARRDVVRAARSAFWVAFTLLDKPDQQAVAGGWIARVRRLLDECPPDCAERGLWCCAVGFQHVLGSDMPAAESAFQEAARIATVTGDPDLAALARQASARVLLGRGQVADGLSALDEVMVAVTCGDVTPMIAGVVYCSVIGACQDAFDLGRARQWTMALASWCEAHPDMVPFRTACLIRRSELLQLHGAWQDAMQEARGACQRAAHPSNRSDVGAACYQRAELHRLQGQFEEAERAYRQASLAGRLPDPGLALLRLAQGRRAEAAAAIRRAREAGGSPRRRLDVLRASVPILVAHGDLDGAGEAAARLDEQAGRIGAPFLRAAAAMAAGMVDLARERPDDALASLHAAAAGWRDLGVPYELACTRVLIGTVYRRRGDDDGARLEWEAAQEVFERLGAVPDAARTAECLAACETRAVGGLTGREIEVLRLVARGRTNRAIASDLGISEKTVARHLSNIFTKLDLSSRAAATAYAYEHKLV